MKKKNYVLYLLLYLGITLLIIFLMQIVEIWFGGNIAMLYPKGIIALRERNLLFVVQALMLLIVIPVFILTFLFFWKYRYTNEKADYRPDWDENYIIECIWWGIPVIIVFVIAIFTWKRSHELDPFKPLESDKKPITIQVIALQWKWLFLYPEEQVASLNFLKFPEKTPISFEITADAPMNSFWIPQLGGQIYAMPKMKSQLHLMADEIGNYKGSSANISGVGFADMHFIANVTTEEDFKSWVEAIKSGQNDLTWEGYTDLVSPSQNDPPTTYKLQDVDIFHKTIMKYMMPQG